MPSKAARTSGSGAAESVTWLPARAKAATPARNPDLIAPAAPGQIRYRIGILPGNISSNLVQGVPARSARASINADFPELDGPNTQTIRPPDRPVNAGGRA